MNREIPSVQNQYSRVVTKEGNIAAKKILTEVFETVNRKWRGLGTIPRSGFKLKDEYADFDAEKLFNLELLEVEESSLCIAGQVLQGTKKPPECSAFGNFCTPEHPLGAPMVSSEGACAAYFHYRKTEKTYYSENSQKLFNNNSLRRKF